MGKILANSRTHDVAAEIGERVKSLRLAQNLRIADLAQRSGVSERTITRLENGTTVNMEHFIRILRALGRLQALDSFIPTQHVSPIQLVKMKGRVRKRASGPADG
jgi:transcriptional regulator with XRE-family HTH domain